MEIGNNAAAVLRGFVERIEELEADKEKIKKQRKDAMAFFKDHKLPGAALIQLKKADPDAVELKIADLKRAGAILGVAVYAEQVEPETIDLADTLIEGAKDAVDDVLGFDEDLKTNAEDIKEVYKEVKSAGLLPVIVKKIVAYRKDPDAFDEQSMLFATYKKALQDPQQEAG